MNKIKCGEDFNFFCEIENIKDCGVMLKICWVFFGYLLC